jgi:hypothetical protein
MIADGKARYRPHYVQTRAALVRGLGLAYLAAFASLAVQVEGLVGSRGILPMAELLGRAGQALGTGLTRVRLLPTLFWIDSSDRALQCLSWGGVVLASATVLGVFPGPALLGSWLFYLSLTVAGQDFLGFQWDSLLIEAGLLGILIAPWRLRLDRARDEPWPFAIWLFRWLVFRLVILSGIVKLSSGDPTWRALRALEHHYQTQPLPAWTSWYVHQLPARFHLASVALMFYTELVAPFFILGPRPIRLIGFASMVTLQVLIAATGNYGFFNILTIFLCLSLLDDRDWDWLRARCRWPRRLGPDTKAQVDPPPRARWSLPRRLIVGGIGAALLVATGGILVEAVWPEAPIPDEVVVLQNTLAPLRIANPYGLFAVMTTRRPEITVEGSDDGEVWRPYRFRWKPDEPDRRPRFTPFHLPRLDWQMWFAALRRDCRSQPWFLRFEQRLMEGSPPVLALLRENPFPGRPPRYVRSRLELYRFTSWGSRDWWERSDLGDYCPPITLGPGDHDASPARKPESRRAFDGAD